eukprot:CAMPEP_0178912964 /NCGR_PEP_ID=MMETSP0786-20121207/10571_1 /TAXON_ID=186022 /ORGANISM="Thalassionema frauenfeldii, Strain CCMP 1798" /LENGTH=77 /DNA_ID=CAMNT_0020585637 /DNA_START=196 /DNA_END=429 /DNA_ORIENTATION=+
MASSTAFTPSVRPVTTTLLSDFQQPNIDSYDEDRSASMMMMNLKKKQTKQQQEATKEESDSQVVDTPWKTGVPSLQN